MRGVHRAGPRASLDPRQALWLAYAQAQRDLAQARAEARRDPSAKARSRVDEAEDRVAIAAAALSHGGIQFFRESGDPRA